MRKRVIKIKCLFNKSNTWINKWLINLICQLINSSPWMFPVWTNQRLQLRDCTRRTEKSRSWPLHHWLEVHCANNVALLQGIEIGRSWPAKIESTKAKVWCEVKWLLQRPTKARLLDHYLVIDNTEIHRTPSRGCVVNFWQHKAVLSLNSLNRKICDAYLL